MQDWSRLSGRCKTGVIDLVVYYEMEIFVPCLLEWMLIGQCNVVDRINGRLVPYCGVDLGRIAASYLDLGESSISIHPFLFVLSRRVAKEDRKSVV